MTSRSRCPASSRPRPRCSARSRATTSRASESPRPGATSTASAAWVDGRTLWFTVKAWKNTARNVALSLHKGDPVVVTGRLSLDEWDGPDGPRTSLVVEATALGPDLTLGEARFTRTVHRRDDDAARRSEGGPADEVDGVPPAAAGTLDPTGESDAAGGGDAGTGPGDGHGEPAPGEPVREEPRPTTPGRRRTSRRRWAESPARRVPARRVPAPPGRGARRRPPEPRDRAAP